MQFLPEAAVVSLFVVAGLQTPKKPRAEMIAEDDKDMTARDAHPLADAPNTSRRQDRQGRHSRPRQERPMRLGDYRPSRLIRNAISEHR